MLGEARGGWVWPESETKGRRWRLRYFDEFVATEASRDACLGEEEEDVEAQPRFQAIGRGRLGAPARRRRRSRPWLGLGLGFGARFRVRERGKTGGSQRGLGEGLIHAQLGPGASWSGGERRCSDRRGRYRSRGRR